MENPIIWGYPLWFYTFFRLSCKIQVIKQTEPTFWKKSKPYYLFIHHATRENFIQATKTKKDIDRLRKSSYDKGGYAFQLWTLLKNNNIPEQYNDMSYKFGAAVQIADDIYDRKEDMKLGQCTLATCNSIKKEDRLLVSGSVKNLLHQGGATTQVLLNAWNIHMIDSLKYYDSGKLTGRWMYSIGQNLLEIGVVVMPIIPFYLLRKILSIK